jgi:uncharacterized alkaline shock family protein YloU
VTKVAGIAAREVPGVHALGGGAARAIGSVTQKVGLGDARTQGVSVEAGETEAAVDLTIVIDYGESIPRVADAVRDQIIKRVEGITGLKVIEVNITVNDLYFPGEDEPTRLRGSADVARAFLMARLAARGLARLMGAAAHHRAHGDRWPGRGPHLRLSGLAGRSAAHISLVRTCVWPATSAASSTSTPARSNEPSRPPHWITRPSPRRAHATPPMP